VSHSTVRTLSARRRPSDSPIAPCPSLWFLAKFRRYALPPLFGTFRSGYGVSTTQLGTVFSPLAVGEAAVQFPSGALADRVGGLAVVE
jgi:MFS family permease